ncbi:MAG: hypothetical protein U0T69_13830 [Chitinophagales bacterium]
MVSFWYQSDGSPYAPLVIKESNEVPLYFYVNGNDFIFGNSARDRFYSNDPNAYGNYFEIVKDPSKHFTIYGNKKPVKQLFYYGIEQYLSHFINAVLYKSESIESYRQHFPLRFVFETDIEEKEKSLIITLFTEAGYDNVESIDYNNSLFEVLLQNGKLNKNKAVLILNGIDNNLYLELYKDITTEPIGFSKLDGQGADPRVKILADMIIEYISAQNPYLIINKESEIGNILPVTASLLENITPIIKGEVEFIDGNKYWFRVNARTLEDRLLFSSNDALIYTAIDDLLKSNGLNVDNTIILLGCEEINTQYFINRLLKKYPNVKGVESTCFNDTMKLIFKKIIDADYLASKNIPGTPPIIQPQNIKEVVVPEFKKPIIPTIPKVEESKNNVKLPPVLPPIKVIKTSTDIKNDNPIIPKLPEVKKNDNKNNPVILPPLPPKKKTNSEFQLN